ncbi:MAG: hypothetical protein ACE5JD_17220 [Candidatus Methylomirabilia bacterium]
MISSRLPGSMWPFLALQRVAIALVMAFPALALWLPSAMITQ